MSLTSTCPARFSPAHDGASTPLHPQIHAPAAQDQQSRWQPHACQTPLKPLVAARSHLPAKDRAPDVHIAAAQAVLKLQVSCQGMEAQGQAGLHCRWLHAGACWDPVQQGCQHSALLT